MRIFDFDEKFYEYVRAWVAVHPDLDADQVEDAYNGMMEDWLKLPAPWLDGEKPGEYFRRFGKPEELIALLEEYFRQGISLPEPLYSRITELGESCVSPLAAIAADADKDEALRANALALLRDIGSDESAKVYTDLICNSESPNEPAEMAVDILSAGDGRTVEELLSRYENASEYARDLILDVCSNFPGDARIPEYLTRQLRNRPERRAYYASLIGRLGDPSVIGALKEMLDWIDLDYLDYIELRNAIERLGGDPGEEREFYGNPDFEALRNI